MLPEITGCSKVPLRTESCSCARTGRRVLLGSTAATGDGNLLDVEAGVCEKLHGVISVLGAKGLVVITDDGFVVGSWLGSDTRATAITRSAAP